MTSHWFFWVVLGCVVLHEVWDLGLTQINIRFALKNKNHIPDLFRQTVTVEQQEKSVCYTVDKSRFGLFSSLVSFLFLIFLWFSGFFGWLDSFLNFSPLTQSVVYCLVVAFVFSVFQIPFSLYSHFVLEERYGFNKMTLKIFLSDLLKGYVLGALLGVPLLYAIFWLIAKSGALWWVWAFGLLVLFQLFVAAIYPAWLAPLFNKFIPLPEGELKDAILAIAKKVGFKMSGIYTIDGSKRSSHSNAYFAGMGKMRRIVLFDTLEKQMTHPEIVAVLAHEMGHNIKRHVQKNLIFSSLTTLVGFWILSLLMTWEPFYTVFSAGVPAPHKALVFFSLFSGAFTFWLTPVTNYLSRKYEYEADRFAVESTGESAPLVSALVKLCQENLSNLNPHPLYSFYHYSHPTTVERAKAIELRQVGE